jgi:hypothetical protein
MSPRKYIVELTTLLDTNILLLLRPFFWPENLPLQFTELYKKLGAKVMKKELNYLSSKRWEKVGRQELRSTPCNQEINPWSYLVQCKEWDPTKQIVSVAHEKEEYDLTKFLVVV